MVVNRPEPKPRWVFNAWAEGRGCAYCSSDKALPVSTARRLWWLVKGEVLTALFGWWWWEYEPAQTEATR